MEFFNENARVEDNNKVQKPIYRSSYQTNYCVFKIGKKFKDMETMQANRKHNLREIEVPNADIMRIGENRIIKGSETYVEDLQEYISDINLRSNQVIAREIILSASRSFFKNIPQQEIDKWIIKNKEFMEKEFGDNYIFACVHNDETTCHIHNIVTFKMYDEKMKKWKLRHNIFFDGPPKLREWQTKYADYMAKDFTLSRGIKKYCSAKEIDIRTFYGIINEPIESLGDEEVIKRAKLLDIKMKRLETTLKSLEMINNSLTIENSNLKESNKVLKDQLELEKKISYNIMTKHHIPVSEKTLAAEMVKEQKLYKG